MSTYSQIFNIMDELTTINEEFSKPVRRAAELEIESIADGIFDVRDDYKRHFGGNVERDAIIIDYVKSEQASEIKPSSVLSWALLLYIRVLLLKDVSENTLNLVRNNVFVVNASLVA